MANLYEISRQLENFDFEVDPETGEILNAPAWDDLNMSYANKVEDIACYIKNLNNSIYGIKLEEDALKKRRQAKERKVEYLKRLLEENMDGQKFETAKCAVSFRKSTKLEVLDADSIPKAFMVETVTVKPDANAIKAFLKEGHEIPGCFLVDNLNAQIR